MKLPKLETKAYICELLYLNTKQSITGQLITAFTLLFLFRNIITHTTLLLWGTIFTAVLSYRTILSIFYFRNKRSDQSNYFWYWLFLSGSLLSSITWSSAIYFLYPDNHPAYQLMIIIIGIGLSAGSTFTLSADKLANLTFSQPVLIMVMIQLYMSHNPVYQEISILLVFLDAPLISSSFKASNLSMKQQEIINAERKMNVAKTDFLTNMSHEIRTPMNAVIGIGHLLEKTNVSPRQHAYISKLHQASHSLLGIINNILDFSRIESGQMELEKTPFSLHDVIETVRTQTEIQAREKAIHLSMHIDKKTDKYFSGDPLRIAQVLTNLISNAIKFTEHGGVHLQVNQAHNTRKNQAFLTFKVSDTGPGIKKEDQKKLFRSFTQLNTSDSRKHGGTGLGLAISQRLVRLMGSDIEIKSIINSGSIFSFSIWLRQYHASSVPTPQLRKKTTALDIIPELTGKSILLVDDNELNRDVAKEILLSLGLNVELAKSAHQAFLILEQQLPDLIFMDLQMPEVTGYEALDIIKANTTWKNIPIVALTANASIAERKKSLQYGMSDFLSKPFDPGSLKQILLDWIPHNHTNNPQETAYLSTIKGGNSEVEIEGKLENLTDMLGSEAAIRLFKTIDKTITKDAAQLHYLLNNNHVEKAAKLAHKLKGSLNIYGSEALVDLLTQIEERATSPACTNDLCTTLETEFNAIQNTLDKHLNESKSSTLESL